MVEFLQSGLWHYVPLLEVYKCVKQINPVYLNDMFTRKNLYTKFETMSYVWVSSPNHIKWCLFYHSKVLLGFKCFIYFKSLSTKDHELCELLFSRLNIYICRWPGPTFIKPDQRNPWIKDQLWNDLLSTILHLQLPNFVSCGRDKPSHMTQNLVTVGVKL